MLKWNLLMTITYIIIFQYFLISSKNLKHPSFIKDYYSLNQTINTDCPENCFEGLCDNITLKCYSCIDGYYKDDCSAECPTINCQQCNQDSGQCEKCKDDLIIIDGYCCDNFCKKCNDDGCTECADETKYGSKCINCPENCYYESSSRKCDQDSGNCYFCVIGKTGNTCEQDCNKGCDLNIRNCDMNDGSCECKEGFYGDKCENKCDDNCKKCNSTTGICYQCETGYYPKGLYCLKCPENCDGECPEGKCEKCKVGFYGEICDKKCSIFCEGNICNQEDGLCECINHFSKESYCTECLNQYDIQTNCTKCLGNYDLDQDCEYCLKNYDLTTNCEYCLKNYDLTTNCEKCINHYDLTTDCQKCLNHYSESSLCDECEEHFTVESECTQCEGNYDLSLDCQECLNHYDISTSCEKCENHYSLDSKCTKCEYNYDPFSDCKDCLNYFDISTNCQECLKGYYGVDCKESCSEGCNTTDSNCRKEDGYCENCYFPYYGNNCESKSEIDHCVIINKTNGECVQCKETYYLTENKTCEACSTNCMNSSCEDISGNCISCESLDNYGDKCDLICSEFCNKTEGKYTCERKDGKCIYGCINDNFKDLQCMNCQGGFFPQEEGCNQNCSEYCLNKQSCNQTDGSCIGCFDGYWSFNCSKLCNEKCDKSCDQVTGQCKYCREGYYPDKSSDEGCSSCPTSCLKCANENNCYSCVDGKFGTKCEHDCSPNCKENRCDIDGNCPCNNKYYGEKCSLSCDGCADNGCNEKTGICIDHYCSARYYDPRMCNKTCGDKCGGEGKCDLFTGECIICYGNKWGDNCDKECSTDCEVDGRVDCCYAKDTKDIQKGINVEIIEKKKNNNLGEEQDEFYLFNINLGGFDLIILADFETNSPLVIFDSSTEIKKTDTEIYNISIDLKYNSSNSSFYIEDKTYDVYYEYDGFSLIKEKMAKDKLVIKNKTFDNFTFLICQEYKIEKEFDNAGKINGIVGLGLRNFFTENLFWSDLPDKLPKNILIKSIHNTNNKKTIHIGDYTDEIKKSFTRLSTMEILNKKQISMNKLIQFETSFTGIAYSLRKAYQYQLDKNVILDNRKETTIVFNNLYKQFFEKIYFGELFENGCYYRSVQGGEGEYYCDIGKRQAIQNLPKLGLILGDYIYYLSYHFLFKESGQFITFIIKLHGQSQQRIELGKSFFNEFSVVYNNGNETLNFYGEIKKLNVPLKDPSNLLNIDTNIFTPGGWVTLIVFITALLIIFCYLSKYCFNKNDSDESDEDEIEEDDDEGALIDDTLE